MGLTTTFIPAVTTAPRALFTFRSTALGRPLISHVLPTRRATLIPILCQTSEPAAEAEPEISASADPSAEPTEEVSDPVAEAAQAESETPEANEQTDVPAAEPVVAENAEEAEGEGESTEESSENVMAKDEGEKKRRRRMRPKKNVTLPLENLTPGMELEGTVNAVMDYGAFVGGFGTASDGLLHVSQLGAGYVNNVSDRVKEGDKVKVRILSVDLEKKTFSLTMKTPEELAAKKTARRENPRAGAAARQVEQDKKWETFEFDPEVFVDAKVMSVTDFGGFCQLLTDEGGKLETAPTDGLVHISQLSTKRVAKVSDVLTVGDIVKVRVVSTDRKRNRISMSLIGPDDEDENDAKQSADMTADVERANQSQPEFKTAFELAFERAEAGTGN